MLDRRVMANTTATTSTAATQITAVACPRNQLARRLPTVASPDTGSGSVTAVPPGLAALLSFIGAPCLR